MRSSVILSLTLLVAIFSGTSCSKKNYLHQFKNNGSETFIHFRDQNKDQWKIFSAGTDTLRAYTILNKDGMIMAAGASNRYINDTMVYLIHIDSVYKAAILKVTDKNYLQTLRSAKPDFVKWVNQNVVFDNRSSLVLPAHINHGSLSMGRGDITVKDDQIFVSLPRIHCSCGDGIDCSGYWPELRDCINDVCNYVNCINERRGGCSEDAMSVIATCTEAEKMRPPNRPRPK